MTRFLSDSYGPITRGIVIDRRKGKNRIIATWDPGLIQSHLLSICETKPCFRPAEKWPINNVFMKMAISFFIGPCSWDDSKDRRGHKFSEPTIRSRLLHLLLRRSPKRIGVLKFTNLKTACRSTPWAPTHETSTEWRAKANKLCFLFGVADRIC